MKTTRLCWFCLVTFSIVLSGCHKHADISLLQNKPSALSVEQEKHSTNSIKQAKEGRIYPGSEARPMCCWYIVHTRDGNHGYAFDDAQLGFQAPFGEGIYPTIKDVCEAIKAQHPGLPLIIPEYPYTPQGWEMRRLNNQEMSFLISNGLPVATNMMNSIK